MVQRSQPCPELGEGDLARERGARAKTLRWNELEVFKEQEECLCDSRVVREKEAGISRGQNPELIMKGALHTSARRLSGYVFPGTE